MNSDIYTNKTINSSTFKSKDSVKDKSNLSKNKKNNTDSTLISDQGEINYSSSVNDINLKTKDNFDHKIHSMNTSQFINSKFKQLKTHNLDFVIPFTSNKNIKPLDRSNSEPKLNSKSKSNLNFKEIKMNFKGIEETKQLEEIEFILKDLQSARIKSNDQKPRFRYEVKYPKSDNESAGVSMLNDPLHPSGMSAIKCKTAFKENVHMFNNLYRNSSFDIKSK